MCELKMARLVVQLLLLLVLDSVAAPAPSLRGSAEGLQQIVVFDAGSSGTRVHIFNLGPPSPNSQVPTIDQSVRSKQTKKVRPGLSSFAESGDLEGAGKSIEELLKFADEFVDPERRSSTPVLLKATAGLRAVEAAKAEKVLAAVRIVLSRSSYESRHSWVSIIPGKEEGGLAWVSANYLAGTFDGKTNDSLGVIELGGGSAQVTFEIGNDVSPARDDTFVFTTLSGRKHRLYAHSYLGYGQDHAQERMRAAMPAALGEDGKDPCYPSWYSYQRKDDSKSVQGTGKAAICKDLIKSALLGSIEARGQSPGAYSGEPPLKGKFVATENFFWERDRLKLPMLGDSSSMSQAAEVACEKTSAPVSGEALVNQGAPSPDEPKGCFGLSYQAVFLEVLRPKGQPEPPIEVVHQINGGDVDWAVGAALVHSLSAGRPHHRHKTWKAPVQGFPPVSALGSNSASAFFFFSLLLLVAGAFGCVTMRTVQKVVPLPKSASPMNLAKGH